ncbi:TonB-dependent receptor [Halioxenophilus sp. WMMB6]|uniref:TonB-dependent receptor n=1 Tax=Halioxenophilus sp. WMMB6 TaxID=3073815 RepID=UPI00295F13BA|nr:TonB-dependent receptor [Halioxenophilus sp. WMMB6]
MTFAKPPNIFAGKPILKLLAALLLATSAHASLDTIKTVDLPQQPLARSIIAIGQLYDISVIFPTHLLQGKQAPAITGEYSSSELLAKLLKEPNLALKPISNNAVAIVALTSERADASLLPTYYEEITVKGEALTGSRVPNAAYNTVVPVDIVTAPELSNSGAQTLVEFLKFTPAVSGNSTSTTVSNGGDGTANVTLRGLPANNTLVLVNGRRVAYDGLAGNAVDLNTIAPIAVDRIEILTDGASAIYGSDAIAGVVNIVLKQAAQGLTVDQYYGVSSRGDMETITTNLLANHDFERGNLLVAASAYEQDGLFSRDRSFSRNADARDQGGADLRSSATPAARITLPTDEVVTLDTDTSGNYLAGTTPGDFRTATDEDRYNYNEVTSSTSPSERQNLYLAFNYQLNDNLLWQMDANYANTSATITLASMPLFTSEQETPALVAADNRYNPFGTELIDVRRRLVELGNRQQEDKSDSYRYASSLDGYLGDLHWNGYLFWSQTRSTETTSGLADLDRVVRALGPADNCQGATVDGCVPLNLFGAPGSITPDQVAYIAGTQTVRGTSDLRGFGSYLDGTFLRLPAGETQWAAGVEWRHEGTDLKAKTSGTTERFVSEVGSSGVEGRRRVTEAFLEWHLPLLTGSPGVHSLDLELAGRYSHYSDFGNNTSPKVGLKYRPIESLLLRSSFGRGFRAPSLDELNVEGLQSQLSLTDPCANEENVGVLPGCLQLADINRTQFLTIYTGDADLQPETSENTTAGVVWTPTELPGLRATLDWFYIDQKNIIDTNPQAILDENAASGRFADLVVRGPDGNIMRILAPAINLGTRQVTGLDFTLQYLFDLYAYGNFALSANGVNLMKYEQQADSSSAVVDYAGSFTDSASEGPGPLPKWKASIGVEWTKANWQLNYSLNYIDSMTETYRADDSLAEREINSWLTHNLQLNYQYSKNLRLTLGIDNLFDEPPPFVASSLTDNFDGFGYNPKQQFFYCRFSANFH